MRNCFILSVIVALVSATCNNYADELAQRHNVTSHATKLIVDAVFQAVDPIIINQIPLTKYDILLRQKNGFIYVLGSTSGTYIFQNGVATGDLYVKRYDRFLALTRTDAVNMSSITACNTAPGEMRQCDIDSFDVDTADNYWFGIKITDVLGGGQSDSFTVIVKTRGGNQQQPYITKPCGEDDHGQGILHTHVTTTCDDSVIVGCGLKGSVFTLRIYSSQGKPLQITQLANFQKVTSMTFKDNIVWVHTIDNYVRGYDISSWAQSGPFDVLIDRNETEGIIDTQVYLDYSGNIIVGQTHDEAEGAESHKLVALNPDPAAPAVFLQSRYTWANQCYSVVAYLGLAYQICNKPDDDAIVWLNVLDYLK